MTTNNIVEELSMWSAIADKMTSDMALSLATHAEAKLRNELVIEESEAFIWIMRRATSEWQRSLGYLRRECAALGDRIAEDRRRATADTEVEEMRRGKEARDSANALRREVESLSALRDRLRDEVSTLSQANQPLQTFSQQNASATQRGSNMGEYPRVQPISQHAPNAAGTGYFSASATDRDRYNTSYGGGSLGGSHSGSPPMHTSFYGGANGNQSGVTNYGGPSTAPTNSSLGVLRSVREQLREIRETNNVSTPQRGGTPQRSSSPSAQQWKERLSKLQGDLRTLRSELGTTPYRGQGPTY